MSLPVVYLPEAEDDIDAAYRHYEGERVGLGGPFLEALREVIDQIRDHPKLYGVIRGNIRAVPLRGFPYVVYYRDRQTEIVIIAVQHGRRSSRAWRGRG